MLVRAEYTKNSCLCYSQNLKCDGIEEVKRGKRRKEEMIKTHTQSHKRLKSVMIIMKSSNEADETSTTTLCVQGFE